MGHKSLKLAATASLAALIACGGSSNDGGEPATASGGGALGNAGGGAGGTGGTSPDANVSIMRVGEGGCLPRAITVDQTTGSESFGQIPCALIEASFGAPCSCDAAGRGVADASLQPSVLTTLQGAGVCGGASGQSCGELCSCEIAQFSGAELVRCQNELAPADLTGFCYVDDDLDFVNLGLVADCPVTSRRRLRFLDPSGQTPRQDATTLIACQNAALGG